MITEIQDDIFYFHSFSYNLIEFSWRGKVLCVQDETSIDRITIKGKISVSYLYIASQIEPQQTIFHEPHTQTKGENECEEFFFLLD